MDPCRQRSCSAIFVAGGRSTSQTPLLYLLMRQRRRYQNSCAQLSIIEAFMDFKAFVNKKGAWIEGLLFRGLKGAHDAASGLNSVHVIIN